MWLFLHVPGFHDVGGALGADAVIVQDFLGGGDHFLAGENERFSALTGELDDNEIILGVAEQGDEMLKAFDDRAVDLLDHARDRIAITFAEAMGEKGRGDHHQLFPSEGWLVTTAGDERIA